MKYEMGKIPIGTKKIWVEISQIKKKSKKFEFENGGYWLWSHEFIGKMARKL